MGARFARSKPSVVETNVSQSAGSKGGGPDGAEPCHGLPEELACLGVVGLLFEVVHLHAQGGVRDRGFVFLWYVKLTLLLETCACVALTQGLEGRPMLGELLRDTLLGRDDGLRGLLGLLESWRTLRGTPASA